MNRRKLLSILASLPLIRRFARADELPPHAQVIEARRYASEHVLFIKLNECDDATCMNHPKMTALYDIQDAYFTGGLDSLWVKRVHLNPGGFPAEVHLKGSGNLTVYDAAGNPLYLVYIQDGKACSNLTLWSESHTATYGTKH